jgi:hypothetical protein
MTAQTATAIRTLISTGRRVNNQSIDDQLQQQIQSYTSTCGELGEKASPAEQNRNTKCKEEKQQLAEQYIDDLRVAARETYETKRGYYDLVSRYGAKFGSVLDLIEYDVTQLQKKQDENSKTQEVHPFNSSNLTKTTVDLTTPGIGGIQLFQSFGVDRVPNILQRGYYVVTKVNHEFGDSGWVTKIQGRFRYNPQQAENTQSAPCKAPEGTCSEVPATTTPSIPPTPAQPNPPAPSNGSGSPAPSPVRRQTAAPSTTREDHITQTMPTVNNQELVSRLEQYENSTDEPSFGTLAARENWQRRVQNGSVARDKVRLEATKAEIRKRNNAGLQAGRGIPREFYSISDARLRPSR